MPTAKNKRKWPLPIRILVGLLAVFVLVPLLWLLVLILWPDVKLDQAEDLIPLADRSPSLPQDNAGQLLADQLKLELLPSENDFLKELSIEPISNRSAAQWSQLGVLTDKYSESINLVINAIEQDDWGLELEYSFSAEVPYLKPMRDAARLLQARSQLSLHQGNTAAAIDYSIANVVLGQKLNSCRGGIIHKLVAISIAAMGQNSVIDLVDSQVLTEPELLQLQKGLERYRPESDCFADTFRVEYQMLKRKTLNQQDRKSFYFRLSPGVHQKFLFYRLFFHPNRSINEVASRSRLIITDCGAVPLGEAYESYEESNPVIGDRRLIWVKPNAAGKLMLQMTSSYSGDFLKAFALFQTVDRLSTIKIAAERYRLEHGRSIDNLDDLVPDFLSQVPLDPFSGQPIQFNPASRRAYSVGSDRIDQQGGADRDRSPRQLLHRYKDEPAIIVP